MGVQTTSRKETPGGERDLERPPGRDTSTAMLPRVLEPEIMDTPAEALAYDTMDHRAVNRAFVDDLMALCPTPRRALDLGTGTALIPIVLAARAPHVMITAVDLAPSMLRRAAANVARAALTHRISLVVASVGDENYFPGDFDVVMSNSLAHHLPDPTVLFHAIHRVAGDRAAVFVRDLMRPETEEQLEALVQKHTVGADETQRGLFAASLRAALTPTEVESAVASVGLRGVRVRVTSDRHWTLARG